MVVRRISLPLALVASAAIAVPAAQAGSGAPSPDPAIVGNPIARTSTSLSAAADFIDQTNGALAGKPLTAARRYLIRSYNGARYLIALPPPPAAAATASAATFRAKARSAVKRAHRALKPRSRSKARSQWISARSSGAGAAGPVFADTPTAAFDVLTSQYGAVTAAVGMYPDTTGALQNKVKLVLNTAIILRNRLVKAIAAAEPPAAAAARVGAQAHASGGAVVGVTFAPVMPGLIVLLDDEIQQMTAAAPSLPAASRGDLQKAIAADQKIETLVNTTWPPAPAG